MAVLVISPNGSSVIKASLTVANSAADVAGKTVVVTGIESFSGTWRSDAKLKIGTGGRINQGSSAITINSPFEAGFHQVFTGTGAVTFGNNSTKEVHTVWFPNYTINAGLQAAINAAQNSRLPVNLGNGTYTLTGTSGVEVDLALTSLIGYRATLDATGMSSGYALWVYASSNYSTGWRNQMGKVAGIRLLGNGTAGVNGLKYGHETVLSNYDTTGELLIEDISIEVFDKNIEFINNSWRPIFRRCYISGATNYQIYYPTGLPVAGGLANSGEVMQFDHCKFVGTNTTGSTNHGLYLGSGQWDFIGCSLLVGSMVIDGDATVTWTGGNLENPGTPSTGYRYIWLKGNDSSMYINGGRLVLNDFNSTDYPPGYIFGMSPIKNDALEGRLVLNGFKFFAKSAWFDPSVTDGVSAWISGDGPVSVSGASTFGSLMGHTNILLHKNSAIFNGDAELNATTGWTVSSYGSGTSTFTATTGSKYSGTYGFYVNCAVGGGVNATQKFPAKAGQLVILNAMYRGLTGTTAPIGYLQIQFSNAAGDVISTVGSELVISGSFGLVTPTAIAPNGTAYVAVIVNGKSNTPTASSYYIDNIYMNIL